MIKKTIKVLENRINKTKYDFISKTGMKLV